MACKSQKSACSKIFLITLTLGKVLQFTAKEAKMLQNILILYLIVFNLSCIVYKCSPTWTLNSGREICVSTL